MFDRYIAAFTECPSSGAPPGEVVRFVNISADEGGNVRVIARNSDGSQASIEMPPDEWAKFKAMIAATETN